MFGDAVLTRHILYIRCNLYMYIVYLYYIRESLTRFNSCSVVTLVFFVALLLFFRFCFSFLFLVFFLFSFFDLLRLPSPRVIYSLSFGSRFGNVGLSLLLLFACVDVVLFHYSLYIYQLQGLYECQVNTEPKINWPVTVHVEGESMSPPSSLSLTSFF